MMLTSHVQGLETSKRAQIHLNEFQRRMEQLRPTSSFDTEDRDGIQSLSKPKSSRPATDKSTIALPAITVRVLLGDTPTRTVGGNDPVRLAQDHPPEDQHWIACMKQFNKYAKDLLEKESGSQPVTVALIDDGVDFADDRIASMVKDGRSDFQRSSKHIAPFWTSSGGHGTAMAGLIRTVCPIAKLFVVRLNEYTSENGRRQIYADSAARVRTFLNRPPFKRY